MYIRTPGYLHRTGYLHTTDYFYFFKDEEFIVSIIILFLFHQENKQTMYQSLLLLDAYHYDMIEKKIVFYSLLVRNASAFL